MRCSRTGAGLGSSATAMAAGVAGAGVGSCEIGSAGSSSDSTILPTFFISSATQADYVRESTVRGGGTRKIPALRSWFDAWAEAKKGQVDACPSIPYGFLPGNGATLRPIA